MPRTFGLSARADRAADHPTAFGKCGFRPVDRPTSGWAHRSAVQCNAVQWCGRCAVVCSGVQCSAGQWCVVQWCAVRCGCVCAHLGAARWHRPSPPAGPDFGLETEKPNLLLKPDLPVAARPKTLAGRESGLPVQKFETVVHSRAVALKIRVARVQARSNMKPTPEEQV